MKKSLKICVLSLMSCFVFVGTCIKIDVPLGFSTVMLGFSNVFCLLSGLTIDPISAGLCSGVGSAIFDITNPRYILSTPFTFASKFLLAYVCGKMFKKFNKNSNASGAIAATIASSSFLILRVLKVFLNNCFALGLELWPNIILTSKHAFFTAVNLILGILCAILLEPLFKKAIKVANLEGVFE